MTVPPLDPRGNPSAHCWPEARTELWLRYADGYALAAEIVAAHLREHQLWQERLMFPVVGLWRHSIELRLKQLGLMAASLIGEQHRAPTHHDLLTLRADLLHLIDKAIASLGGSRRWERREALRVKLSALANMDPNSTVFRYPEDALGVAHACELSMTAFDGLVSDLARLSGMLEGIEQALIAFGDAGGTQPPQ